MTSFVAVHFPRFPATLLPSFKKIEQVLVELTKEESKEDYKILKYYDT